MKTDAQPLIALKAWEDALCEALRAWNTAQATAIMERRHAYQASGLPYGSHGGGSEAVRRQRQTDQWEEAGLIVCTREGGKRVTWRLADATDLQLRGLVGINGNWSEMLVVMKAVQFLDALECHNAHHVPEWLLAGVTDEHPDARRRCLRVADAALPALCRGWLTSNCDREGAVGYALEDAGREIIENKTACPVDDLPAYDPGTCDTYLAHLREARAELDGATPEHPNHVAVALSAGDWPRDEEARGFTGILNTKGDPLAFRSLMVAIRRTKPKRRKRR